MVTAIVEWLVALAYVHKMDYHSMKFVLLAQSNMSLIITRYIYSDLTFATPDII